jgi:hypothetical protein
VPVPAAARRALGRGPRHDQQVATSAPRRRGTDVGEGCPADALRRIGPLERDGAARPLLATTTPRQPATTPRQRPARVRRVLAAAGLLAGLLLPAGCVAERRPAAPASADVVHALEQAGSAVSTAVAATQLWTAGRLPRTTTDTALLDASRELEGATTALATMLPPDHVVAGRRSDALAAVAVGTSQVADARAWVSGATTRTGEDVVAALDETAARLDDLAAAVAQEAGL